MLNPVGYAWADTETLGLTWSRGELSRRDFLKFCGDMAVIAQHRKHGRATSGEGPPIAQTAERHLASTAGVYRVCRERPSNGRADDR